jgi:3-oxoacyl-[acyl-carrier protein] reductase
MTKKITIIIGGSSGIGRSLTEKLLNKGKKVLNIDLTPNNYVNKKDENNYKEHILEKNDQKSFEAYLENFIAPYYELEGVVVTAGKGYTTSFNEMNIEQFQQELNDNLVSVYQYIDTLKPYIKEYVSIVLVGSVASYGFSGSSSAYSSAKAGIVGLTKNLAMTLGEYGVRVNCVVPGNVETDLFNNLTTKMERDTLAKLTPLKKNAKPHEIADGIEFLLSENSTHITGQTLVIDGGLSLSYRPFI